MKNRFSTYILLFLLYYIAIKVYGYDLPWQEFATFLQCVFCCSLKTATAWDYHTHDGNAFDIVLSDDLGQFVCVICIIKLWTSDQRDSVFDKIIVKVSISICCAICSNQQICTIIIRGRNGYELDLDRPL